MTELQNLFLIDVVLAAVAVPLIRGWIPPNRLYGFRTEEALSTPDIWYPANRALGWSLLVAAVAALAFGLTLLAVFPEWAAERTARWWYSEGDVDEGRTRVRHPSRRRRLDPLLRETALIACLRLRPDTAYGIHGQSDHLLR